MIDIRFLRENPDAVKENIRKKFQDAKLPLVDEVIALDEESRKTQAEADDLRSKRNKVSKQIGALMGQGKKEEAEKVKAEVAAINARIAELEPKEAKIADRIREITENLSGINTYYEIPFAPVYADKDDLSVMIYWKDGREKKDGGYDYRFIRERVPDFVKEDFPE